jgi:hypothetical protein
MDYASFIAKLPGERVRALEKRHKSQKVACSRSSWTAAIALPHNGFVSDMWLDGRWQLLLGLIPLAGCGDTTPVVDPDVDPNAPIQPLLVDRESSLWISDLAVGKSDEIAIVGSYKAALSLGDGWSLPAPAGRLDFFAGTLSESGHPLWAAGFGTIGEESFRAVAFDDVVTAAGHYGDVLGEANVVRFDDAGLVDREQSFALSASRGVATSPAGDTIVMGIAAPGADFGGGALSGDYPSANYIASFDVDGNWLWDRTIIGECVAHFSRMAVDSSGAVVAVGVCLGKFDLGPSIGVIGDAGNWDTYVAKFDAGGEPVFAQTFGAGDRLDVATTSDDGIVIAGFLHAEMDLGDFHLSGTDDAFVAKFDALGQVLWVRTIESTGAVTVYDMAIDSADNLLIAAGFRGTMETPGASSSIGEDVEQDAIVIKLDPSGEYLWERAFKALRQGPYLWAIDTNSRGEIFVAGDLLETADFGGITVTAPSTENYASFVAKLPPLITARPSACSNRNPPASPLSAWPGTPPPSTRCSW